MVLFIYICSLAARLKFENNQIVFLGTFALLLVFRGYIAGQTVSVGGAVRTFVSSVYSSLNLFLIGTLAFYLLLGLVISIQVANKFEGPLKHKINNES